METLAIQVRGYSSSAAFVENIDWMLNYVFIPNFAVEYQTMPSLRFNFYRLKIHTNSGFNLSHGKNLHQNELNRFILFIKCQTSVVGRDHGSFSDFLPLGNRLCAVFVRHLFVAWSKKMKIARLSWVSSEVETISCSESVCSQKSEFHLIVVGCFKRVAHFVLSHLRHLLYQSTESHIKSEKCNKSASSCRSYFDTSH